MFYCMICTFLSLCHLVQVLIVHVIKYIYLLQLIFPRGSTSFIVWERHRIILVCNYVSITVWFSCLWMFSLLTLVWFSSIRGITLFSTNPKILRALQCKECTVPPCILMLNVCLGGDVIIWSIGCTRNKWLTGRNRQSGLKCFNWVCTVDKPTWRKMKIFNAIFKNGLIKIKIKTLSAECFS